MRLPTIEDLAALAETRAGERLPAASLRAAIDISDELTVLSDALIERFVVEARAAGLSWNDIGQTFGTSKQAVQQRYGPTIERWPGRWTPAANAALDRAGEEARALGHDYVGTEHVLLALVTAGHGVAAEVLHDLGVGRDRMLSTSCMRPGAAMPAHGDRVSVMPRLKQALEHGRRIADGLDVPLADTEHLLAGIVAVSDSMAVEILRRLGVTPAAVRASLADRLDVERARLAPPRRRRRGLLAARH